MWLSLSSLPQRAQWTFCSPLFPEQLSQESAELLWGAGEKAAGPPAGPRWRGQAEVGWVSPAAADKGLPGPAPRRGAKGLQLFCPGCAGPSVSYQLLRTRLLAFAQCRPACGGGGSRAQLGTQHASGPACKAPWRVQCSEFSGW